MYTQQNVLVKYVIVTNLECTKKITYQFQPHLIFLMVCFTIKLRFCSHKLVVGKGR